MDGKAIQDLMGARVCVSAKMVRREKWSNEYGGRFNKWWERKDLAEPVTGWVVGIRMIQDGFTIPGSEDEGPEWRQRAQHQVVLVSVGPRHNPIRVPIDGYALEVER